MPDFAVLLRGVNVGGGKRVPMADFRRLLESLGYTGVRTLLNSGNAVFSSTKRSVDAHAKAIHAVLVSGCGVDTPVIVKSAQEVAAIIAENPMAADDLEAKRLIVVFRQDPKTLRDLDAVGAVVKKPERWHLGRHAAYLYCANGILQSAAGKALLGHKHTTNRNWATVLKIGALLTDT